MTLRPSASTSFALGLGFLLAAACSPHLQAQTTLTFQQGTTANSLLYLGSTDRTMTTTTSTTGAAIGEIVLNNGTIGESQYFIKFDSIFGTGAGLIPTNATVLNALLTLKVGPTTGDESAATSSGITVAPMLVSFTSATSLVNFTNVTSAGTTILTNGPLPVNGLTKYPTALTSPAVVNTAYSANVTNALQGWMDGTYANNGFVVQSQTTNNLRVNAAAATTVANRPILTVTYVTNANTTSFVTGVNGYTSFSGVQTQHPTNGVLASTVISSSSAKIVVDGPTGASKPGDTASPDYLALLKFDNILGSAVSQVPKRATINKALFMLTTGVSSNDQSTGSYSLYRMITPWTTATNYDSFGGIVGPVPNTDYVSSGTTPITTTSLPQGTSVMYDVSADITAWNNGTAAPNGWLLRANTTDGWSPYGPGATNPDTRPQLKVIYSIEQVRWTGTTSSIWDMGTAVGTGGTNNWNLETAATVTNFISSDRALFDDSATGTGTVTITLNSSVTPQRTTFANSTRDYVLQGTGAITGGGEMWKTGTGRVTITNDNSFTGGGHIYGGTVQLGSGGTTGSMSTAGTTIVDSGATLEIKRSDTVNINTALTGAGNLVVSGTGRVNSGTGLALTGNYSVTGGTLAISSTARPTSVTAAAGTTIAITSGTTTTTSIIPSFSLAAGGANLQFELATPTNPTVPLLSVTNTDGLNLNGGTQTLTIVSNGSLGVGTFTLINYTGTDIATGFNLQALPQRLDGGLIYNTTAKSIDLSITGQKVVTWNGAVDGTWDIGTGINQGGTLNWVIDAGTAGAAPTNFVTGDKIVFNDTAAIRSLTLTGAIAPSTLTVNSQYNFVFGGTGTLAPTGSLTKDGAGRLTLLVSKTSTSLNDIKLGVLQVGDSTNSATLAGPTSIAATANLNLVNGSLTGVTTVAAGAGLRVDGGTVSGALTLNGSADFYGSSALAGAATLGSGAALNFKSDFAGTLTGNIVIATGATVTFEQSATVSSAKTWSGTGEIVMNGSGTTIYTGAGTGFTGNLTINAGVFAVEDPTNTLGDLNVTNITVNNGGAFRFGNAGIGNPDLPNSTFVTLHAGGLFVSQEAEDFGGVHLLGGTIRLEAGGYNTSGGVPQDWRSGTVTTNATAAYFIGGVNSTIKTTAGTVEINGAAALTTTGALQIFEGKVKMLTAANLGTAPISIGSDSSVTTPTAGVWEYAGVSATRAGAINISPGGGSISVSTAGSILTLTGLFSGATDFSKIGAGNLTLGSSVGYSGTINVDEGGLVLGFNSTNLSTNTVQLRGGSLLFAAGGSGNGTYYLGKLVLASTLSTFDTPLADMASTPLPITLNLGATNNSFTYAGTFSGAGSLQWVSSGALTLTGASTHTGETIVTAGGTLLLSNANAIKFSTLNLYGGTVVFDEAVGSNAFAVGGLKTAFTPVAGLVLNNSNATTATGITLTVGAGNGSSQFDGVISGLGGLTKVGNGTLILGGNNSYTGATMVSGGTLGLAGVGQLTGGVTIAGGTLQVGHANALDNVVTLNITGSGGLSWAPSITKDISAYLPTLVTGTTFTFDTNGNYITFANGLSGAATIQKIGTGSLQLKGPALGFTGNFVLTAGELTLATDSALGAVPANVVANQLSFNGGALRASANVVVNANRGMLINDGKFGYLTPDANLTMQIDGVIAAASANTTLVIGGPQAFFNGAGTVVLTGANTFNGSLLLQDAALSVNTLGDGTNPSPLGLIAMTPSGLTFSGGSLIYTGTGESTARDFTVTSTGARFVANGSGALVIASSSLVDFTNDTNSARKLTLGGTNTGNNTFAAEMFESDIATAVFGSLLKEGVGKWLLSGPAARFAPSFVTDLNAGQLTFAAGALGGSTYTGAINLRSTVALAWAAGNTDDLSARLVLADASTSTLVIAGGSSVRFNSAMRTGSIGDAQLTKQGTGTLELAAASAFTGGFVVENGMVIASAASALGTGVVTVNGGMLLANANLSNVINVAGGVLGGTGSVGATSLASGATLDPGVGVGTFTLSSLSMNGGSTLKWELADTSTARGVGYDALNVTGLFDLSGASSSNKISLKAMSVGTGGVSLNFVAGQPNSFSLLSYNSLSLQNGQNISDLFFLDFSGFKYADGTAVNSADWQVVGDANSLSLSAIPEPSTYGLGLGALALALVAVRRSRRRPVVTQS